MPALPRGTVTLLFTDVEGSTAAWESDADAMRDALVSLDAIVGKVVDAHGGILVKPRGEGDSHFCVFTGAADAVASVLDLQRAVVSDGRLSVRAAVHTGEPDIRDGDYYGPVVNRAARLRAIAHGGQTLLSEVAASLAADLLPDGAQLRAMGSHRLKDLTRSESVWQLDHTDLPSDFPPLRSLDTAAHNLPVQLTSLIGREHEVGQLRDLVDRNRLVTLVGIGGAGKTRLALQVAAELVEHYPGGVWLAQLAGIQDGGAVAGAIARALGVSTSDQELVPALVARLQAASTLLVLDNCEHVIVDAARVVGALLRGAPELKVLATSRLPLRVGGEIAYQVPVLTLPDPAKLPPIEALPAYGAVRLFIERATAARPDFAVTNDNAPAVAGICARLDGIPLAIELAAARVRVLTVDQMHDRLDDRLSLLTGGARTELPHHETLRAALDWSHDLLSEPEQTLWRRLGVFHSPVPLHVVERVCTDHLVPLAAVLDLVASLVDHSLVQTRDVDGEVMYSLLETVREYARERLAAAEEVEVLGEQHAAWCTGVREPLGPRITPDIRPAEQHRRRVLHDDVVAALRWREAGPAGAFVAAAVSAAPVLDASESWLEAEEWLSRALRIAQTPADRRDILAELARTRLARRAYADARADAEAALGAAREAVPSEDLAPYRLLLARTFMQGEPARMLELAEEEAGRHTIGTDEHIWTLKLVASARGMLGDFEGERRALLEMRAALDVSGRDDARLAKQIEWDLVDLDRRTGDPESAIAAAESMVASDDPEERARGATALYFCATDTTVRGEGELGAAIALRAAQLFEAEGRRNWAAHAMAWRAEALALAGDAPAAEEAMSAAARGYTALGDRWSRCMGWLRVGFALRRSGAADAAVRVLTSARQHMPEEIILPWRHAAAYQLAALKIGQGLHVEAVALLEEALGSTSDADDVWSCHVRLAQAKAALGEHDPARAHLDEAEATGHVAEGDALALLDSVRSSVA